MNAIIFDVENSAYSMQDVKGAITVNELIEILQQYDGDDLVITRFDNGYTFGKITEEDIFPSDWLIAPEDYQ